MKHKKIITLSLASFALVGMHATQAFLGIGSSPNSDVI